MSLWGDPTLIRGGPPMHGRYGVAVLHSSAGLSSRVCKVQ